MLIDLTRADLEQFTRFVFDHPVAPDGEPEWYFAAELEVRHDPIRQVALMQQLFERSGHWQAAFTPGQIEQGLWFVFNGQTPYFTNLLWESAVPWEGRLACLRAILQLYTELFTSCPVETIDYMIPDLLADGYGCGSREPAWNVEERRVQEALLELFGRMLDRPESAIQYAGLHGLGHLRHPSGPELIDRYLSRGDDLEPPLREYALRARTGDVL